MSHEPELVKRFWERVNKAGPDECWMWKLKIAGTGYGLLSFKRKLYAAHRLSYELAYGPIQKGLFVLHSCDVKACVNPAHLHGGTHTDNMREMHQRGRAWPGPIGVPSPYRKLTDEQVRSIRKNDGLVPRLEMARQHNVAHNVIYSIVKGQSYKDVV